MRFTTLAASLLATLATAQTNLAQAGAYGTETALTTWTLTRTVERVVQTVTATRNGTQIAVTTTSFALGTPSLTVTPYGNSTGTGVYPTGTGVATQSAIPYTPTGAGVRLGMDLVGLGAVAGLIGLVAL